MSDPLGPLGLQHTRVPCPLRSPRVCSNSCPLSQCCDPTISSSVTPFSSCLQSFPASGSFPVIWLFTSGGQSVRTWALTSVLPMNMQGWFPLGLTGHCIKSTCWYWKASLQETGTHTGIICWWQPLWETCCTMRRHAGRHRSGVFPLIC